MSDAPTAVEMNRVCVRGHTLETAGQPFIRSCLKKMGFVRQTGGGSWTADYWSLVHQAAVATGLEGARSEFPPGISGETCHLLSGSHATLMAQVSLWMGLGYMGI